MDEKESLRPPDMLEPKKPDLLVERLISGHIKKSESTPPPYNAIEKILLGREGFSRSADMSLTKTAQVKENPRQPKPKPESALALSLDSSQLGPQEKIEQKPHEEEPEERLPFLKMYEKEQLFGKSETISIAEIVGPYLVIMFPRKIGVYKIDNLDDAVPNLAEAKIKISLKSRVKAKAGLNKHLVISGSKTYLQMSLSELPIHLRGLIESTEKYTAASNKKTPIIIDELPDSVEINLWRCILDGDHHSVLDGQYLVNFPMGIALQVKKDNGKFLPPEKWQVIDDSKGMPPELREILKERPTSADRKIKISDQYYVLVSDGSLAKSVKGLRVYKNDETILFSDPYFIDTNGNFIVIPAVDDLPLTFCYGSKQRCSSINVISFNKDNPRQVTKESISIIEPRSQIIANCSGFLIDPTGNFLVYQQTNYRSTSSGPSFVDKPMIVAIDLRREIQNEIIKDEALIGFGPDKSLLTQSASQKDVLITRKLKQD